MLTGAEAQRRKLSRTVITMITLWPEQMDERRTTPIKIKTQMKKLEMKRRLGLKHGHDNKFSLGRCPSKLIFPWIFMAMFILDVGF